MKSRIVVVLLFVGFVAILPGGALAQSTGADARDIEYVIRDSYVDALFRTREPEQMARGFHESFVMQRCSDEGKLSTGSYESWLEELDGEASNVLVRADVRVLDITGVAASARVDVYKRRVHEYTDYFGLYRTGDGWRIVSKVYHSHDDALDSQSRVADESEIKELIETNYVDALFRRHDPDLMRAGFASTFAFHLFWDDEVSRRSLEQWLAKMDLDKQPSDQDVRGEVTVLDITGNAAVAKLEFFQDDQRKYTDYFGLYRAEDGWRIVTKHFHAHGYEGHRAAASG